MEKDCLNCGSAITDAYRYCPQCGQKTTLHRLSLHDVWHGALHYFTHADKGFLQLIRDLAVKTGSVAREYVGGKRQKYFPPLNFFLMVAAILVLVMTLTAPKNQVSMVRNYPQAEHITDPVKKEAMRALYARAEKARVFFNKYSNIVAMVAMPLMSFIYWLFYARGKYNYTEHMVAGMYLVGFTNLVYAIFFIGIGTWLHFRQSFMSTIVFFTFHLVYNSVFYYRFINKGSKASAVKATAVTFFVVAFWFVFSICMMRLYISNGFWGLMK